jgi:hypothetical protein
MQKAVLVFRLLAIGCLKAMPIFRQLTSQDQVEIIAKCLKLNHRDKLLQVIMVQNLHNPIKFFTNAFYSVKRGFTTCTAPDGVAPMAIYKQQWDGDEWLELELEIVHYFTTYIQFKHTFFGGQDFQ